MACITQSVSLKEIEKDALSWLRFIAHPECFSRKNIVPLEINLSKTIQKYFAIYPPKNLRVDDILMAVSKWKSKKKYYESFLLIDAKKHLLDGTKKDLTKREILFAKLKLQHLNAIELYEKNIYRKKDTSKKHKQSLKKVEWVHFKNFDNGKSTYEINFIPNKLMCNKCVYKDDDCNHLRFNTMKIGKQINNSTVRVVCNKYLKLDTENAS